MAGAGMSVDMRRTKLSAADAALIAGEVTKPSWASRNEGIHERVSFDDTLWGFELAGGVYYNTPLRVVHVKENSRAEQANIKKGDTVKRINGLDTATLTLQEAHDIIVESGIHLRISVTSPEDEEDAYYTYEDPLVDEAKLAEELRKAMEAERIRKAIERANRACNLPWPWVRRKIIIYRESNCFLVPSKYEGQHKDHYPELPHVRYTDDITEMKRGSPVDRTKKNVDESSQGKNGEQVPSDSSVKDEKEVKKVSDDLLKEKEDTKDNKTSVQEKAANEVLTKDTKIKNPTSNVEKVNNKVLDEIIEEEEANKVIDEILEESEDVNQNVPSDVEDLTHSDADDTHTDMNGEVIGPDSEEDETMQIEEHKNETNKDDDDQEETEILKTSENEIDDSLEENETTVDNKVDEDNLENVDESLEESEEAEVNPPTSDYVNDDDDVTKSEDDNIADGIVGDADSDSTKEK